MSFKSTLKKLKKKVISRPWKFVGKAITAPYKYAKKHPVEVLTLAAAAATGGTALALAGGGLAAQKVASRKSSSSGSGSGPSVFPSPELAGLSEAGYGAGAVDGATEEALEPALPAGIPPVVLIGGAVVLVALLLRGGRK